MKESKKEKLDFLSFKIADFNFKRSYISKEISDLYCSNIPVDQTFKEKCSDYLLRLEEVVCNGIENNKKKELW